jgi:hypothetical protein
MKKKIAIGVLILVVALVMVIWYIFTVTYDNTADLKPDFEVQSVALINEFEQNKKGANAKYVEKLIEVTGNISVIEKADSIANIKMIDESSGSYLIFAFQPDQMAAINMLKPNQNVVIRGSCSGGVYSEILEVHTISFKRSIIVNQ